MKNCEEILALLAGHDPGAHHDSFSETFSYKCFSPVNEIEPAIGYDAAAFCKMLEL